MDEPDSPTPFGEVNLPPLADLARMQLDSPRSLGSPFAGAPAVRDLAGEAGFPYLVSQAGQAGGVGMDLENEQWEQSEHSWSQPCYSDAESAASSIGGRSVASSSLSSIGRATGPATGPAAGPAARPVVSGAAATGAAGRAVARAAAAAAAAAAADACRAGLAGLALRRLRCRACGACGAGLAGTAGGVLCARRSSEGVLSALSAGAWLFHVPCGRPPSPLVAKRNAPMDF